MGCLRFRSRDGSFNMQGRLNRVHELKNDALIFDYLDENHALANAMFRRRLAGCKELGYQVEMPQDAAPVWFGSEAGDDK